MQRSSRFQRFEPVTVRAAARVMRMAAAGRLPHAEAGHYVRELCELDRFAGTRSMQRLARLARWWSAFGYAGTAPPVSRLPRARRTRGAGVALPL